MSGVPGYPVRPQKAAGPVTAVWPRFLPGAAGRLGGGTLYHQEVHPGDRKESTQDEGKRRTGCFMWVADLMMHTAVFFPVLLLNQISSHEKHLANEIEHRGPGVYSWAIKL